MALLELEGVVRRYREGRRGPVVEALRAAELAVGEGEVLAVVGPNGSGKTTLLETLAFLARPDEGTARFDGADPWADGRALQARRACPILRQQTTLFATTVLKNAMYGLRVRGMDRREAERTAREALALVGLQGLEERRNRQLSGGERRRVGLAQVLALDSRVIVLDEPTAGLDSESERICEEVIRSVHRQRGTTIVLASHNLRQATDLSTRVVTLLDGKLVGEHLDNVFTGLARERESGYSFESDGEAWRLELDRSQLTGDVASGPAQLAIPASGLLVGQGQGEGAGWSARIESVRRRGEACQLGLSLEQGPVVVARIELERYGELGLNLGSAVTVRIRTGAARVLPLRRREARQ